jgi:phage host-nuclease inhibitor protein Gam
MSDLELTMMRRVGELNKENARLKADVNELADGLKLASEVGIKMADEVTRLKAEVERLTKAGDTIIQILCKYVPPTGAKYALMDWRDAKEGKQP